MEEEITEEQRRRAEASRAAALAKRKAIINESNWNISKCRKLEKFCARLEICSPDSFLVTPLAVQGFTFPGQQFCFQMLTHCLSTVVVSRYTQSTGGEKACVYKLEDYQSVLRTLKSCNGIDCEEIPWGTYNVIERLSHSYISGKWIPCRPEHLPDDKVDQLISKLPKGLLNALLPFQLDGVRFGVRRGGRCLIADEMGLGKTLQAIAIAGCFMKEGSILVVCPAILRYTWAEELERWFPYCLPTDIHLVFGHQDNPARLPKCPKVVVTSYTMLRRLQRSMLEQEWVTLIVDESHHLHCTKRSSEKEELTAVLGVAMKVKHLILLSGTPSLSRPYDIFHQINMLWPGLLGQTKYEYAKTYCSVKFVKGCQGKVFQDFSKGVRLEELNVLLKQSVMIRRLKEHVLPQLPPKRRQIINLVLRKSDVKLAMTTLGLESGDASEESDDENAPLDNLDENHDNDLKNKLTKRLSALGVAKLPGFFEWLSIHPIMAEMDGEETREESSGSQKMIIFSYHHKVLDGVQAFLCEKGIQFVRIDCNVTGSDRHSATQTFQYSKEVRIALIGIRSGGSGLNLTAADNVVFVELPLRPADIQQAEDRAHRHGQRKLVNIYIFCAKDTVDELHWRRLNRSLLRVSSTVNGKYGAIREIEVESVCNLETTKKVSEKSKQVVPEVSENNIEPREELMKFEDSCFSKDLKPVALSSGSSIKLSCGGENECNVVLYKKSKLQFEKHTISRNDESSGRAESEAVLCSHSLKKSNDGKRQKVVSMFPQTKLHDDDCTNEVEYGVNSTVQATPRFEVSRYTGRIHLYSCISGTDLRPKPLFVNFRQEEVECHQNAVEHKKMTDTSTEDNELYREALIAFITEWKKLRPIEKKKLTGKPLQLPLSYELCYLNESLNHDIGGLLRGGSKRRKTPRDEISYPLPSNAAWRKVNLYGDHDQKEKLYTQGWSEVDEPLCKLCQTPCKKNNAKVPQFFEDLFCSLDCFEEYRSRTSSRFLREELFKIEKGICADCRLDCHRLVEHLRPLSLELRQAYIRKEAPNIAKRNKLLDKLVQDPIEGNAWHADHIIPVYKGGGECKLENMRTLCVACHSDVTTAQCAERRIARNKAKKQLKDIMNGLINAKKSGQTNNVLEDCDLRFQQNREDHDLLIEIPGSAYSGGNLNVTKDSNQEQEVPPNQCTNYLNPGSDEPLKLSGNAERLQELDNLCDPESSCINRKQASGVETGTKGGEEQQGETLEFTVIDKR